MPATDSGATRSPFTSWRTISRGPDAQSKLTHGTPAAIASCSPRGKPSARDVSAQMLALAHSLGMSVVLPGSSTRSHSPCLRISRTRWGLWWPWPRIRSRQPGSRPATSAKAWTSLVNCFSITSRPAATMVRESSSDGGANPCGSGLGMATTSGATAPSSSRSQSAMVGVSSATTSARGALTRSGSSPEVRCEEERCSWCTTTTASGASCTAEASREGVTVTSTSVARPRSPRSRPRSVSAENCLSHRRGTSRDSRACSASS
jgi:hypothetical protein